MKKALRAFAIVLMLLAASCQPQKKTKYVWQRPVPTPDPEETLLDGGRNHFVVGYVSSWSDIVPNPYYVTHINYAFGHVTRDLKGVRIDKAHKLKSLVELKKDAPHLKVLLSIGGWGSGNFSEMARDAEKRMAFAKDCKRVCEHYHLDGIDIDWEYPGSSQAGIGSSSEDRYYFTSLMRDLRAVLGPYKVLSYASPGNANYIDAKAVLPYVDFVNVMAYDLGLPPNSHNAGLYRSDSFNNPFTVEDCAKAHLNAGIPPYKIVMGMPFYGRGYGPYKGYMKFSRMLKPLAGHLIGWDQSARVPYIHDNSGKILYTFENERSLTEKCSFIRQHGFLGAMIWELGDDDPDRTLSRTVAGMLL